MQTIDNIDSLHAALTSLRRAGDRVALVPTMGALHAGHLALVDIARAHADRVVVSIFVNPKQFGPNEDFDAYPRTLAEDEAKLRASGADLVWVPTAATMYPPGFATSVSVKSLGDHLCGTSRPGHFDGVATVVTKLFAQVRPDVAVFGEKDWQQLAIIRQLNRDLNLAVEIIGAPILRESDGLALSSRNAYLDAAERRLAVAFPSALAAVADAIIDGADVHAALARGRLQLRASGISDIDYIEVIDGESLAIVRAGVPPKTPAHTNGSLRVVGAVRIGKTRLIDNMPVGGQRT